MRILDHSSEITVLDANQDADYCAPGPDLGRQTTRGRFACACNVGDGAEDKWPDLHRDVGPSKLYVVVVFYLGDVLNMATVLGGGRRIACCESKLGHIRARGHLLTFRHRQRLD